MVRHIVTEDPHCSTAFTIQHPVKETAVFLATLVGSLLPESQPSSCFGFSGPNLPPGPGWAGILPEGPLWVLDPGEGAGQVVRKTTLHNEGQRSLDVLLTEGLQLVQLGLM